MAELSLVRMGKRYKQAMATGMGGAIRLPSEPGRAAAIGTSRGDREVEQEVLDTGSPVGRTAVAGEHLTQRGVAVP